jgi:hypothetical protein
MSVPVDACAPVIGPSKAISPGIEVRFERAAVAIGVLMSTAVRAVTIPQT